MLELVRRLPSNQRADNARGSYEETTMNLFLFAMIGAMIAWLASFRLNFVCRQRLMIDAAIGATGAVIGGMLSVTSDQWLMTTVQPSGIAASVAGAVVMLAIVRLRAR